MLATHLANKNGKVGAWVCVVEWAVGAAKPNGDPFLFPALFLKSLMVYSTGVGVYLER